LKEKGGIGARDSKNGRGALLGSKKLLVKEGQRKNRLTLTTKGK